jgi:hypothetical protein
MKYLRGYRLSTRRFSFCLKNSRKKKTTEDATFCRMNDAHEKLKEKKEKFAFCIYNFHINLHI